MTAINRPAENIHVIYLHFVEELFFVFIKGLQFFCFKYCSQYFIIVRARSLPSFYPGHQRPTCPQYLLPPQGLPVAPLWKGPTSPPFSNARTTGAPALGTMIGLKKKKITRGRIGCAERTRPVRVCASVDQGEERWAFSSREGTAQSPRATVGPHACTTRPATPG